MLYRQLDGTMGAQSPWRVDRQPGAINAPKPGSVGARAMQANSGGPLAAVARRSFETPQPAPTVARTVAQPQTQTQTVAQTSVASTSVKETKPGSGANRSAARGSRRSMMGAASSAFAGNVGSVNTEEQNDDVLLPYMKGNI